MSIFEKGKYAAPVDSIHIYTRASALQLLACISLGEMVPRAGWKVWHSKGVMKSLMQAMLANGNKSQTANMRSLIPAANLRAVLKSGDLIFMIHLRLGFFHLVVRVFLYCEAEIETSHLKKGGPQDQIPFF